MIMQRATIYERRDHRSLLLSNNNNKIILTSIVKCKNLDILYTCMYIFLSIFETYIVDIFRKN